MSKEYQQFKQECALEIITQGKDTDLQEKTNEWFYKANSLKYSYHFEWLSRPIIQYPQDIVAMQEIIWDVKPDLIIETGIAHGGSLIFFASMLALLDMEEAIIAGNTIDPRQSTRQVLGIDIDIRHHNREAIEHHPMSSRIKMLQGSSTDHLIVEKARQIARGCKKILVSLDSNHTHQHVLAELEAYAPLTSEGSYCVVFDTVIDDMPADMFPDRPWGPGNSPKTAVNEYLSRHPEFILDKTIQDKLLITVAPGGFLKRIPI